MNKSSVLLAALLVASGAVFAAEPATTPHANDTTTGAKERRGLSDVGNSVRQMGRSARDVAHDLTHRDGPRRAAVSNRNNTGYGGDTRADMSGDAARRQRMDEAYANWQTRR